jgi:hypothetical protein
MLPTRQFMRRVALVATLIWSSLGLCGPGATVASALDAAAARKLIAATEPVAMLPLSAVTTLAPDVCTLLSRHPAGMDLSGLKDLSEDLAKALSRCRGQLVLDGLEKIPDPSAEILASCPAAVSLRGLTELRSAALTAKLARQCAELQARMGN